MVIIKKLDIINKKKEIIKSYTEITKHIYHTFLMNTYMCNIHIFYKQ